MTRGTDTAPDSGSLGVAAKTRHCAKIWSAVRGDPEELDACQVAAPAADVPVFAAAAPQPIKHIIYRRVFGWDIHPTARFGFSLIAVDHLSAAEGVIVWPLNVIKGCDEVRLGVRAGVGPMNWISSPPRSAGLFPTRQRAGAARPG